VDGIVMPASENLHRNGLMHRSNRQNYSITSSAVVQREIHRGRVIRVDLEDQMVRLGIGDGLSHRSKRRSLPHAGAWHRGLLSVLPDPRLGSANASTPRS
jgi:hypothetical protein